MNIPSFDKINKITDSRYSLVMLVSQRSRELMDGDHPLIDTELSKPVSIAIEEAVEGAIGFATEEEHRQKVREDLERKLEEAITEMEPAQDSGEGIDAEE